MKWELNVSFAVRQVSEKQPSPVILMAVTSTQAWIPNTVFFAMPQVTGTHQPRGILMVVTNMAAMASIASIVD
jgi:hypothetical protein